MPKMTNYVDIFHICLNFVGTANWAQLDFQSIQHRDYFGHLSFFIFHNLLQDIMALSDVIIALLERGKDETNLKRMVTYNNSLLINQHFMSCFGTE